MRVPLRVVSFNLTMLSELTSASEITSVVEADFVLSLCDFLGLDFFLKRIPRVLVRFWITYS